VLDMGRADQARSTACGGNPARTAALGAKGYFGQWQPDDRP